MSPKELSKVDQLRRDTPYGLQDCSRALRLAKGDMDRAKKILNNGLEEYMLEKLMELEDRIDNLEMK